MESILQDGDNAGHCKKGFDDYCKLFKTIGEHRHKSCLLTTSREKIQPIVALTGKTQPVREMNLQGLKFSDSRKICEEVGDFIGTNEEWEDLCKIYAGNPLALELSARHISDVYLFG